MFYKTVNSLFCIYSLGSIHAHIRALIPAPTGKDDVNKTLATVDQIKRNVQNTSNTMAVNIEKVVEEQLNTPVEEKVSLGAVLEAIENHEGNAGTSSDTRG